MKLNSCVIAMLVICSAKAQQPLTPQQEQQLERIAEREETNDPDDDIMQQKESDPVNLNTAGADELRQLHVLTDMQIRSMLQYRSLLGKFIHLYELQAVPYWDVLTIQKLLPYVTIRDDVPLTRLWKQWRGRDATLTLRISRRVQPKASADTILLGSPFRALIRYRYNYKNTLQYGLLADKDAGEPLFRNGGKGFDFYSFHVFIKRPGRLKALAVGDYTINLGQGLIHWQSLALGKTTEITGVKRQSPVIRPHTGSGEHNFHRGAALSLQEKRFSLTAFFSARKLSANLLLDSNGTPSISSFLITGLHRTSTEMSRRRNVRQQAVGGSLSWEGADGRLAANLVSYRFSDPVLKKDEPYNFFALKGSQWLNYSLDYEYTYRNAHLFGEAAGGKRGGMALVSGLLVSLHQKADASLLVRHINPRFQSLYSDAFTENTFPSNESGVFMGLAFRPVRAWRMEGYADIFRFPWLRFRVDAPSYGREYGLQFTWQPHKKLEIVTRLRMEQKPQNQPGGFPLQEPVPAGRKSWRTHISWHPNPGVRVRQRVELVAYTLPGGRQNGFLIYNDVELRPANWPVRINARVQMFETDGFNARVAAFENDVPGAYSIPVIYNKGVRYYVNLQTSSRNWGRFIATVHPKMDVFLRWAQTFYMSPAFLETAQENEAEYRLQLIFHW